MIGGSARGSNVPGGKTKGKKNAEKGCRKKQGGISVDVAKREKGETILQIVSKGMEREKGKSWPYLTGGPTRERFAVGGA